MAARQKKSSGSDDGELERLRKQVRDLEAALAAGRNTIEALRDGEEQVRAIVEHSTDLFYLHTPDHILKYVSPQSRKFFDCEPKEALVRWTEFLTDNPMNAKGIRATQAAIDTGTAQPPYELELRGLKGRIIRVEVHEAPVVKNGKILAIVGALTDITERKRAEEELSRSKEWLQLLIDRMPVGCIVWDTEFRVSLWNPTAERLFGYSAREAHGKHPYQLIVPREVRPQIDEVWKRLMSGDQTAHSLNENITRDGRTIICDWYNTPLRGNDGAVIGVISMAQDVTDRIKAEEALRRSEAKYRSIFNSASVSLWEEDFSKVKASIELLKAQGIEDIRAYLRDHPELVRELIGSIRVLDVNDTTLKLYGVESKDELLRSLDKVLTPESAGLMLEAFIAIAERRPYFEMETKNRTL
ncbi:MAG TPA: PAS domain-containing protein, partial [Nitrospirota bacterium]|nr:PAS domain-containing protein [Nitrospirota bacterium]